MSINSAGIENRFIRVAKVIGNEVAETARTAYGQVKHGDPRINALALGITFAPNIPAYFLPAYTQASATGNAEELRKKEGRRGIITGAIEGASYGVVSSTALLAAKKITKFEYSKHIVAFSLLLGTGDYFYGKFLSVIGERVGIKAYKAKQAKSQKPPVQQLTSNSRKFKEMEQRILFKRA